MGTFAESAPLARRRAASPPPDARAATRARARLWDRVMTGVLWGVAGVLVAILAYFIIYTIVQGFGVLSWDFITKASVTGDTVGPQVFNTFYILILSLAICTPIGLGCAIYLVEYAKQGPLTTIIRFATETLAGIPSLILGLFGFLVFVTDFGTGARFGHSRIAAALTLVILNLPLMLRVCEDALRSVPNELREGSAALGATKAQTVSRVLVPSALLQITTGIVLTGGKIIGETAAIIFTAGSNISINGWNTLDPTALGETLTVHLYTLQSEGLAANAKQIEAGTAALLIIFLLVFNLGFRGLATLLNRRLSGGR